MKTLVEPFRIKSIERVRLSSTEERVGLLREAHYNVALLKSEDVMIDLLTDSGASSMSSAQWSVMHHADESYVGSLSYCRFVEAVQSIMPFRHVIPTHQGRAAERILASVICKEGRLVPNNCHFDTTRGNFEAVGVSAMDLPVPEAADHRSTGPFKGNMNVPALANLLESSHDDIPLVMLTLTNNTVGGQPVSMENIRQTKELCRAFGKPLFFDACRFAENAYLIKLREPRYRDTKMRDIVREMFSYADGVTMSAKKDALANTGGWLALNDDSWAGKAMDLLLVSEGFVTHGGLTGRDLDAIAIGLEEGIDEDFIRYRVGMVEYLGNGLAALDIPVVKPFGGHAVYIDAKALLPHIPASSWPGQTLNVALYEAGGIRACEVGSVRLDTPSQRPAAPAKESLVRLAIPRRVYTQSHLDYVVESFACVLMDRERLTGLEMIAPATSLSHYAARYRPLKIPRQ